MTTYSSPAKSPPCPCPVHPQTGRQLIPSPGDRLGHYLRHPPTLYCIVHHICIQTKKLLKSTMLYCSPAPHLPCSALFTQNSSCSKLQQVVHCTVGGPDQIQSVDSHKSRTLEEGVANRKLIYHIF